MMIKIQNKKSINLPKHYLKMNYLMTVAFIVSLLVPIELFSQSKVQVKIDTSLQEAVRKKNISLVKKLLEDGDDPSDREGNSKYFSVYSLYKSKSEIEKNKKSNDRLYKLSGWTALHWAVYVGSMEILELLLAESGPDATDAFKSTPLQWAAKWGSVEMARRLIEAGADVDHTDRNGYTALHYAMLNREKKSIPVVDLLIESGADIFVKDKNNRFASHLACQFGYVEALKKMIDIDSNIIYAKDKHGNNMLHLAVAEGYINVVKGILDVDVLVDEENDYGLTALHWAALNQKKEIFDVLMANKADINYPDVQRKTILQKLAQWNYYDMMAYVVDKYKDKIDFQWTDENGKTALHIAADSGNLNVVRLLSDVVNLEIQDEKGETALQKAVYSGRLRIAKFLMDKGANMIVVNEDGESLLRTSVNHNDFEMVQLLTERGANVGVEGQELFEATENRKLLIFLRERLLSEQNVQ